DVPNAPAAGSAAGAVGQAPTNADVAPPLAPVLAAARAYGQRAQPTAKKLLEWSIAHTGPESTDQARRIDTMLIAWERAWLMESGLPSRSWYCNLFAAPDEDSGYASWMLPALRRAVERKDKEGVEQAVNLYLAAFDRLSAKLEELDAALR